MEETKDIKPLTPQGLVDTHKIHDETRLNVMEPIPASMSGMSGSTGPSISGMSGSISYIGPTGSTGPNMSGMSGSTGPSISGMSGMSGSNSYIGPTGSTGSTGPVGPIGTTGYTGGIYANMIHVDMLYNSLSDILGNQELTPLNLASTIVALMQLVENYPKLNGNDKKEILLEVFKRYKREHPSNTLDLDLLPGTIDMFVNLDKGEVTIKLSKQSFLDCLTCCLKTKSQK